MAVVDLTVSSITGTEAGASVITLRATAAAPVTANETVTVAISGADITAGDFTLSNTTITIPNGNTQGSVTFTVKNDLIVEGDEVATVTISNPSSGLTLGVATRNITITDNDTATLSIGNASSAEGVFQFIITSTNPSSKPLTVTLNTAGGTAVSGTDFTAITNTPFTIPGDSTSLTVVVPVTVAADLIVEDDETFTATISNPLWNGGPDATRAVIAPAGATATGTIINADMATLSINSQNTAEGGTLNFTITSTNASAKALTGVINSTNVTAVGGVDYSSLLGIPFLIPGDSTTKTATFSVPTADDNVVEDNETFTVGSASVQYGGVTDTTRVVSGVPGTGTINNNDSTTLSVANISQTESGTFKVTLTSTNPSEQPLTVTVNTVAGTAIAPDDYVKIVNGTATIPGDGVTLTTSITVAAVDDQLVEGNETFTVNVSGEKYNGVTDATRVALGVATSTVTITDNDFTSVSVARVLDGAEAQTPTNGRFRISQTSPSSLDTTVSYTISGTAVSGSDFTAPSGTATIKAGALSTDVDIPVLNDSTPESIKTVIMTLTAITAGFPQASLNTNNSVATLSIVDDDVPNTVSISKITDGVDKPSPTAGKFRVSLVQAAAGNTSVTYTVGGTATIGSDYTALSGAVTIQAGQTFADIDVNVLNDGALETPETVVVTLTNVSGSGVSLDTSKKEAVVTIGDADTATVSLKKLSDGAEAVSPTAATFQVTQSGVSFVDTVVKYEVSGTTISGVDFTTPTGSVTIPAGKLTADINIAVLDDLVLEPTETVVVTLVGVSGLSVVTLSPTTANLVASANITDNDTAVVSIVKLVDGVEAKLPTNAKFQVKLSALSSTDTTIGYDVSGTATSDLDFIKLSGTVTIARGDSTADIDVFVMNDSLPEQSETVILTLKSVTGDSDISLDTNTANRVATATISDTPAPKAEDLVFKTKVGTPVTGTLKATDPDPTGGALNFAIVTQPKNGKVDLKTNGSFTYTTTSPTFSGNDTFTYTAKNSTLTSKPATVTIKVNAAPVATTTTLTINATGSGGGGGAGKLEASDSNQDPLQFRIVTPPTKGTVKITDTATGAFTYTYNAGATGDDAFTFIANDGSLDSNTATANIKVNTPPVAKTQSVTATTGQLFSGQLVGDDAETPVGQLKFAAQTNPPASAGALKINSNGSFTFQSASGFLGTTSFTFTVTDAGQSVSTPAQVDILVQSQNLVPSTADGRLDVQAGVAKSGKLAGTDDGLISPLKFVAVTQPANGSLKLNSDGTFIYTAAVGTATTDSFTFLANDGALDSNVSTFRFAINQPPIAQPLAFDVDAFGSKSLNLPGIDPNQTDSKSFAISTNPTHGTVKITDAATGAFTYESDGTIGPDSFSFTVSDGSTISNPSTVSVTVNAADPKLELSGVEGKVFVRPGRQNPPAALDAKARLGNISSSADLTNAVIVASFSGGAAKGDAFSVLQSTGLTVSGSNIKQGKTKVATIKSQTVKNPTDPSITFKEMTINFKAGNIDLVNKVLAAISAENKKSVSQTRMVTLTVKGLRSDGKAFSVSNSLQATSQ